MNKMTHDEMLKYSAELVVKNNPDEAAKLLIQLQKENKILKEKLDIAETNKETFRLEMLDITKILGLDEHTIFDDVKLELENILRGE